MELPPLPQLIWLQDHVNECMACSSDLRRKRADLRIVGNHSDSLQDALCAPQAMQSIVEK